MDHIKYKKKLRKFIPIISTILYLLFRFWKLIVQIKSYNYPTNDKGVIFALWHHDQLCIDDICKDKKSDLNILISKSFDGEIIAQTVEKIGYPTIRGSKNKKKRDKGGREATFEMVTKLKEAKSVAITVDGPAGPLHKVKKGVITVAKHTGAPIIPVIWYSPSRCIGSLPTWDKMKIPLWFAKTINIYGNPVYIPEDIDIKTEKEMQVQLQEELLNLENGADKIFLEMYN